MMDVSKYSNAYGRIKSYHDFDFEDYRDGATNLKTSGKKLDSFERVSLSQISETYVSESYDKLKLKVIGESGIPGAEKNHLFYATAELMKDFYSGDIDEERIKQQIYEYVKQYTLGSLGKDDHSAKVKVSTVMSDLYEYLSRANSRQAVAMNRNAANDYWTKLGVKEPGLDAYTASKGTVYYDSKYYKKCEMMQDLFKKTFDDIAEQYEVAKVEYEAVEQNTKFSLDGGITFNGVWNFDQLQTNYHWMRYENRGDVVDNDFVPPDDFVYAYANGFSEKCAKSLLDYIKNDEVENVVENTGSKKNLLMELSYGRKSHKTDSAKIDNLLSGLSVNFLKSSQTNIFGDYFRMLSYK